MPKGEWITPDKSVSRGIAQLVFSRLIFYIMIYPVDSAIQLLKNWNENTQLIKMGYTKKNNSIVTIVT